jgi:hypothetical protein
MKIMFISSFALKFSNLYEKLKVWFQFNTRYNLTRDPEDGYKDEEKTHETMPMPRIFRNSNKLVKIRKNYK